MRLAERAEEVKLLALVIVRATVMKKRVGGSETAMGHRPSAIGHRLWAIGRGVASLRLLDSLSSCDDLEGHGHKMTRFF